MKVLYIIHATGMGGATLSFLSMIEGVQKKGVNPIVVGPDHNKEFESILQAHNIPYYVVPMELHCYERYKGLAVIKFPFRMLKRFLIWHKSIAKVGEIACKEEPDIIHTNVGPIHVGHVVAHELSIPHVWHVREYGDKDFRMFEFPTVKFFRRHLASDHVICITKDLLRYNHLGTSPNAHAIYNGVRKRNDVYYNTDKESFFLCASRIEETKGHKDVLKAFAAFHERHPFWKLVILGKSEGPFVNQLKQFVADHHLNDVVSFEGHKSNVTDYMRRARALIVASHFEGFGRMTAEASFAGCMVIGRATGGTLEIMQQTGGLLFNNNDELLSAMEQAASMPEAQYKESVLHAQHIAQQLFSEEAYVDNVYSVYNEIVSGGGGKIPLTPAPPD